MAQLRVDDYLTSDTITAQELNQMIAERDGHFLPIDETTKNYVSATYDHGSATYKWRDGYYSGDLYIGDDFVCSGLVTTFNNTNDTGDFEFTINDYEGFKVNSGGSGSLNIESFAQHFLKGGVVFEGSAKTISSGEIDAFSAASGTTPEQFFTTVIVQAETGTSDTLDTVNGSNSESNAFTFLMLRPDSGDTITLTHNSGTSSSERMFLKGGIDCVLSDVDDYILFAGYNNDWYEISRSPSIDTTTVYQEETLTISSADITISNNSPTILKVETESAAATDDLESIVGNIVENQMIILKAANDARTVVVKNGANNIKLAGSDFSLDSTSDTLQLIYDGTNWLEISRSNNG